MDQNHSVPVKLEYWSVVSGMEKNSPYCRPQETELQDMHLKGKWLTIPIEVDGLDGVSVILTKVTSSICGVDEIESGENNNDYVFKTRKNTYLVGEPDPDFLKVWCCGKDAKEKLAEIVKRKLSIQ